MQQFLLWVCKTQRLTPDMLARHASIVLSVFLQEESIRYQLVSKVNSLLV